MSVRGKVFRTKRTALRGSGNRPVYKVKSGWKLGKAVTRKRVRSTASRLRSSRRMDLKTKSREPWEVSYRKSK